MTAIDNNDALIDAWIKDEPLLNASKAADATDSFLYGTGLSASSRKTYYHVLKRFLAWAGKNEITHLASVKPRHIAAHINGLIPQTAKTQLTNPGKTRLLACAVLKSYFSTLLADGLIPKNPAAGFRPRGQSKQTTPTPALTPGELLRILNAIPRDTALGKRNRALLGLLAGTGCRIAAALGLKRTALRRTGSTWNVTLIEKGQVPHTLPITPAVLKLLLPFLCLNLPVKGERVFPSWNGNAKRFTLHPMSYIEAYRTVQAAAAAAGITDKAVTPHSFRATAITALLEAGHDITLPQRIAGHADPATTRLYDRRNKAVNDDEARQLEKALDLQDA